MPSEKNFNAVFSDTATAIRGKLGNSETIQPIEFADKINLITGGGKVEEHKDIYLNLSAGDQTVNPPVNTVFSSVTIKKPSTLLAENIKKDVWLAGIKGTFEGGVISPDPPYDINTFYPAKFQYFKGTTYELEMYLKEGGTKHLYDDMSAMFSFTQSLTSIPAIDTAHVRNMDAMFKSSGIEKVPSMNTSNVTSMMNMFNGCAFLNEVGMLDTRNVTTMYGMFQKCHRLLRVPAFDCSKVNDMTNMFDECTSITNIDMININTSLDISSCLDMEKPAIITVFENLSNNGSGKVIRIGGLSKKVTNSDLSIARNKGWRVEV